MAHTALLLNRRHTLVAGAAWWVPAALRAAPAAAPGQASAPALAVRPHAALAALEQQVGGRLGVAWLDTASGTSAGHRWDERFALCSTFKLPLAAVVLHQIEQGRLQAGQWVPYTRADILAHAPVALARLPQGGMTVLALAEAAQTTSDNTAANLLLGLLGGPAGFTALLREAGDGVTRVDRLEPHMNRVLPGDPRDTSTPLAMARNTAHWLAGGGLQPASQERLAAWMEATRTGSQRLRAGLPPRWRAGDKTGTAMAEGMTDKYNDVAVTWPVKDVNGAQGTARSQATGAAPLFIAAYYETAVAHGRGMRDEDQAVLAEVGRIAARWALQR